jgi:3',5'-cyclic AMP phosphodiesterase CpdA
MRASASRSVAGLALAVAVLVAGCSGPEAPSPTEASPPIEAPSSTEEAPRTGVERLVLNPAATPRTAQTFTWRTEGDAASGEVRIREVGADGWRSVDASGRDVGDHTAFTATADELEPGTESEYEVVAGAARSEVFTFTTPGEPDDEWSFVWFGDAQQGLTDVWPQVVDRAFRAHPDAELSVHSGDLVEIGGDAQLWEDWFARMGEHARTANLLAAPGNHEYTEDPLLTGWKANFEYPANGPEPRHLDADGDPHLEAHAEHMATALRGTAWFADHRNARFVVLNSTRDQAETLMTADDLPPCEAACPDPTTLWLDMQAAWLDEVLRENPQPWTVVVLHHPLFSVSEGRDEPDLRDAWLPVIERHDVDLVLNGHDHAYARGHMNADLGARLRLDGAVFAVSSAGSKYYALAPDGENVWSRNGATQVTRAANVSAFQAITIDGNELRYESVVGALGDSPPDGLEVGDLLDGFTLTADEDGVKRLGELEGAGG